MNALIFTFFHLIMLPAVVIASLVNGLVPIAVVDVMVFLMLFAVEAMIWPVRPRLSRLFARRNPM